MSYENFNQKQQEYSKKSHKLDINIRETSHKSLENKQLKRLAHRNHTLVEKIKLLNDYKRKRRFKKLNLLIFTSSWLRLCTVKYFQDLHQQNNVPGRCDTHIETRNVFNITLMHLRPLRLNSIHVAMSEVHAKCVIILATFFLIYE